jgi:hypothetical protein
MSTVSVVKAASVALEYRQEGIFDYVDVADRVRLLQIINMLMLYNPRPASLNDYDDRMCKGGLKTIPRAKLFSLLNRTRLIFVKRLHRFRTA